MSGPDPKASERQPSPIPAALTALRAYRVGEVLTLHEDGPRSRERAHSGPSVLVRWCFCEACRPQPKERSIAFVWSLMILLVFL